MKKFSTIGVMLTAVAAWGCSAEMATSDGGDELDRAEQPIVGGDDTPLNVAEASAALLDGAGAQECGGVVISRRWVLTAAHCVKRNNAGDVVSPKYVKVGTKDLTRGGQKILVKDAFEHEDWDPGLKQNDIALVELSEPALVKPARLMNPMDNGALDFGDMLTAVGWGVTDTDDTPNIQQSVELPMLEQNTCYHLGATHIDLRQLCLGGQPGKDTCIGDSGGPVYANINGERMVAGIVSFGIDQTCGTNPAVYTRVSAYTDWINDNAMDNSTIWQFPASTTFPVTETNRVPDTTKRAFRSAPYQVLAGDFNGDKKADQILYQPGTGREWLYLAGQANAIELTHVVSGSDTLTVRPDYEPVVGDFDGNGRSDIYWYGPGSQADVIWWFDASATSGLASQAHTIATGVVINKGTLVSINGAAASTGQNGKYTLPFASKLDSDQKADIGWYEPGQTNLSLWYAGTRSANTAKFTSKTYDLHTTDKLLPLPGKYNGDAYGDIFWYGASKIGAPAIQDFMLQGSATQGQFTKVTSTSDTSAEESDYTVDGTLYTPLAGDFDGNGYTDIYWYEPGDLWNDPGNDTSKQDAIWWFTGTGGYDEVVEAQTSYATPVVGDFSGPDSSGRSTDDILWFEGARARGEKP